MKGKSTDTQHQAFLLSGLPVPNLQTPPSRLKARLLTELAISPPPTRRVISRRTAVLVIGSWGLALAIFALAGGVSVSSRPLSLVAGTSLGISVIAAATAWVSFARNRSLMGRPRRQLIALLFGSIVLILAWKVLWSARYVGAFEDSPSRPGLRCLGLSITLGILPLVGFALARYSSDPLRPNLTGLAAGIAIGGMSAVLTDLWCPVGYFPHLLLGHVLPIVILGGFGAWLGSTFIALRFGSRN